jgi:probable rRNA maturation factor
VSGNLIVRSRVPGRPVDLPVLRRVIRVLIGDLLRRPGSDLAVYLVDTPEMTQLNEKFLQHQGCTDVITFDYAPAGNAGALHGEIFICVPEALKQARRFHVNWPNELVRYVVHGMLHLCGYDDHRASDRASMKRVENRLVRKLGERFTLDELAAPGGEQEN